MPHFLQFLDPRLHQEVMVFVTQVLVRLLLAAVLGGVIGLERELKHKPAGLRTQMFLCIGAAFFTILSGKLAGDWGGDHTRIASQIIPGIGFLGAGSILHSKGGTTGLTTAATIFVVASIGMACGGGEFLAAIFATLLLGLALLVLGAAESKWNLKPLTMCYEIEAPNAEELIGNVNAILADEHKTMQTVAITKMDGHYRMSFCVDAMHAEHDELSARLRGIRGAQQFQRIKRTDAE
ncbi:MAG TPA: MgtC/SapB family protein [Terriglobales bacterium]|nr:MgtC/SapB family protein [Terriglobales bacterium]